MIKSNFLAWLVLLLACALNINAQSITQWRGEMRSGHFPAENLLKTWPDGGPELVLLVEDLPESYSSVVVHEGVIYTTGIVEEEESLTALNSDGSIRWQTVYGDAWSKSYPAARCTPTIEDGYAYVISGSGDLACIDLSDGKLRWSLDGYSKFEGSCGNWGVAESPLIVDDKMIYTPAGEKTTIVAVDKTNGSTIWTSESLSDISGYVSPLLIQRGLQNLIVTLTGDYIICLNANNGNILWKEDYSAIDKPLMGADINPVTPLVKGNEIFITSGYNHTGLMLEMSDDFRSVSVKWKSEKLDVHHGGVVEVDGYIYGSNYTTILSGNWLCLDWNTGELMYEQDWNNKGQIITSNGMLICYEERRGNMALVKATPDNFELISEFAIEHGSGPHWSHPSIYNGRLYLRHGKALLAYKID
ncbi:MAG: PQQ-like beta-propeller repeat protein [Bacteroides sp.]|nr:PQQ-like beta-propeller repeat protein [Bacteroides sp.]